MIKEKKNASLGRKALKWSFSIIAVLLIALISIPFVFKDRIVAMVSNTLNDNINATVTFKEPDLNLFRNFPFASLRVNEVTVINKAPFLGDTLFNAEKINFTIKLTSLFNSETEPLEINSVSLINGAINILFNKNSIGNFDIAKKSTSISEP
jgi:hypothetical protein